MDVPEGVGPNNEWRAEIPPDARPRVVRRIVDSLKRLLPISAPEGLAELHKIVVRFEEQIFNAATSIRDYVWRISVKMAAMERKYPGACGSNMYANTWRRFKGRRRRPPVFPRKRTNQVMKKMSLTSLLQTLLSWGQDSLSRLLAALPSSRQPMVRVASGLQPNPETLQMQRQLPSQQQHMSQLQPHSVHMQQQLPVSDELVEELYGELLEKLTALTELLHPKNWIGQQKQPLRAQGVLPEAPSTSVDSISDVQEEIYQIKSWKEIYFTDLCSMHERLTSKLQQHEGRMLPPGEHSDRLENLRKFTVSVWRLMQLLQLPKSNIHPGLKDKLPHYEKQISAMVSSGRKRSPQRQFLQLIGVIDQSAQQLDTIVTPVLHSAT